MKYYTEICVYCLKQRQATQVDFLPIPNTGELMTRGLLSGLPRGFTSWVSCHVLREHTFVNKQNYVNGQITVDGRRLLPRL